MQSNGLNPRQDNNSENNTDDQYWEINKANSENEPNQMKTLKWKKGRPRKKPPTNK